MKNLRRLLLSAGFLVCGGVSLPSALAQGVYPDRPIRVIVPFTPGGANDIVARLAAPHLQRRLGQPVLVENKPGAGGHIGGDLVAKSPPDGYTLLLMQNGLMMAPWLEKNLPYDPMGFSPIMVPAVLPIALAVNNDLPVKSVAELIAHAKANPGKLLYATPGIGTPQHLFMELFLGMAGAQMVSVPYKGTTGMLTDLAAGRVNAAFNGVSSIVPLAEAQKIRALAVAEKSRIPSLPDLPAVAETLPGFQASFWFGFVAPGGTPERITRRLADELRAIMVLPETVAALKKLRFELSDLTTPAEMAAHMKAEYERWGKVIAGSNIKLQ